MQQLTVWRIFRRYLAKTLATVKSYNESTSLNGKVAELTAFAKGVRKWSSATACLADDFFGSGIQWTD